MKKLLLTLLIAALPVMAQAQDYNWKLVVKYDYSLQVSTNLPPWSDIAEMGESGGKQRIKFLYAPHRTKAQLADTNFLALAVAWRDNADTVTPEMREKAQEWVSAKAQVAIFRTIANFTSTPIATVRKYMKREYLKQLKP